MNPTEKLNELRHERRERAWNNISEDIVKARSQKITYGQYMAKRRRLC